MYIVHVTTCVGAIHSIVLMVEREGEREREREREREKSLLEKMYLVHLDSKCM